MKIAFFSDCYLDLTGGIVTSINAEKHELERRGHTVYVFSSSYSKTREEKRKLARERIFPVKSHRFLLRGITPIAKRPAAIERELMREHPEIKDFDVFFVHYEASCSIAGLRLGKKLGVPTVQVMHGREDIGEQNIIPAGFRTVVAWILNFLHSRCLPHPIKIRRDDYLATTRAAVKMWELMVNHANTADLVLTPSRHFKDKLISQGVNRPVKVLPNGVLDQYFLPGLTPRVLLPGETLHLVWHSRVSGEKRIMPFLKALEYVEGKYRLDVYGDGNDLGRAQRYAKARGLNVKFHGAAGLATIYKAILKSHLDVLASFNFDTFGMTLIEAESVGTPAFFVDPDLKEVVPASGAVLAESPSPSGMAAALNEVLKNPDMIEKMSVAMLKHRDEVRVSRTVDLLEKYLKSVIK